MRLPVSATRIRSSIMRELDDLIDRNMAADMIVYRPKELEDRLERGDPFVEAILKEGRILYG